MKEQLREFVKLESAGGIILLATTIIALLLANSPFSHMYDGLINTVASIEIGTFDITKPLLFWINDGLMAIFFFLIGLEIKREISEGELSSINQVVLPGMGAIGGMAVPAAIFAFLNWGDSSALNGWAIPVATDIAFALALLSVFGKRVPISLKVFLLTLAIFDDLAAIVIIALFYSADLSITSLLIGALTLGIAVLMNRRGVTQTPAYIFVGIILWVAVLKSGVHATLAGVLIAFCVPMRDREGNSPLLELEHNLHPRVAFAIIPVFAFANAGLYLLDTNMSDVVHPVTLGVILGLLVGKPVGIMFFVWLAYITGLAKLPREITWSRILGVSFACGIGFTMSLFIAGLAFEHAGGEHFTGDRLGILIGSVLSAICAYAILHAALPKVAAKP